MSASQNVSGGIHVARPYEPRTADGLTKPRKRLSEPRQVEEFFLSTLKHFEPECYVVAYLDKQLQLITCVKIALEAIAPNSAYPLEILEKAIDLKASALIVAQVRHSGSSYPGGQINTTMIRQLKQVLPLIRVRLLDYITVIDAESTSMVAAGLV